MTTKFDSFLKNVLENLSVSSVLGSDGSYDTSDARNPTVIGKTISRNGAINRKRRNRRKMKAK